MHNSIFRRPLHATLVLAGLSTGCYSGVPYAGVDDGATSTTPDAGDTDSSGDPPDPEIPDPDAEPPATNCTQEATWTLASLDTHCGGCHAELTLAEGGGVEGLVDGGWIVPGAPDASPLLERIVAGEMPPAEAAPLPEGSAERLRSFVKACVGDDSTCTESVAMSSDTLLKTLTADLLAIDADDRPFIRYLTLVELGIDADCQKSLDLHRMALRKTVNALSIEPGVTNPEAVDEAETVFRVDLRNYGWDQPVADLSNKWELLVNANPYAFIRQGDDGDVLRELTGSDVPVMMYTAFANVALLPPTYYELLDIPVTFQELEARLGVDVNDNIASTEAARAGVLDSEASLQNRIIERHDTSVGADRGLWIAYDVNDDSNAEGNIFTSPIDFQETQRSVIFALPNGFQAYALFDGAGGRINEGDPAISGDPLQPDGRLRAGASCIGCHSHVLGAQDDVRDYVLGGVAFDAQTKDHVESLYPNQAAFAALVDDDSATFLGSQQLAGIDVTSMLEPVSTSNARFEESVTLERAAAELGLTPDVLLANIGTLNPVLAPLAATRVKRDTWTARFAETTCALNLGITDDPACAVRPAEDDDEPAEVEPYGDCVSDPQTVCVDGNICLQSSASDAGVCAPQGCHVDSDCPALPGEPDVDLDCRDFTSDGVGECVVDCDAQGHCPEGMVCLQEQLCAFPA